MRPKILAITVAIFLITEVILLISNKQDNNLEVSFLDVGQGDSILVTTPNKKLILIDGGPGKTAEPLSTIKSKFAFRECEVELVIISHPHSDHIKGLIDVFDSCQINNILITNQYYESDIFELLLERIELEDLNIKLAQNTKKISIDKANLQILHPRQRRVLPGSTRLCLEISECNKSCQKFQELINATPYSCDNPNLDSIVVLLTYNNFDVLFTGDAEKEVQEQLNISNIEVLKVPHQGAKDSLVTSFIEKINPLLAVISVGKNNYGHPSQQVLSEYYNRNIKVLRTDQNKNIKVKSDGIRFWIEE